MESSEWIFHVLRRNIPTGGKFYIVYRWYVEIFPYINTVSPQIEDTFRQEEKLMKKITYQDIADYFIALSNESHELISNLKLQKLVYYTQAWFLAVFKHPLFEATFKAWVHGPVIPQLYHEYKKFSWMPIQKEVGEEHIRKVREQLADDERDLLDDIVNEYFGIGAFELERMTHAEVPWQKARSGLSEDDTSSPTIHNEWMKSYYAQFMK